jgi:hypothetical protein
MAAGPTQKSVQITNFDASPPVAGSAGNGAPGLIDFLDSFIIPAAADGAGTKYFMLRVKTSVIVKKLIIENEAEGAGKVQAGLYYADDARYLAGGSQNAGVVIDVKFFSDDYDLAAAHGPTNITYNGTAPTYNISKRDQPLWQAAGLTIDPGGWFDIVLTVHTTDITTGTGRVYLSVEFIQP